MTREDKMLKMYQEIVAYLNSFDICYGNTNKRCKIIKVLGINSVLIQYENGQKEVAKLYE
jgi:hypothetical protein